MLLDRLESTLTGCRIRIKEDKDKERSEQVKKPPLHDKQMFEATSANHKTGLDNLFFLVIMRLDCIIIVI